METEPIVFVVDDDNAVRDGVSLLVKSFGLQIRSFSTAESFLAAYDPSVPGCLVLDIRMPGISGLELHKELTDRRIGMPVIFLTGHGDVTSAVKAMKEGAVDYLQKPADDRTFLDAIRSALVE
ncbi:MAG: response regulator transcription factor, partial [Planctomycetota bacterium]